MPPEPLPWDRKDLVFRDRKHEKGLGSDGLGGGSAASSAPRWRDSYNGPRDFPRASPRRSLPGHYRQSGGYHQLYPDESGGGHGCTPSRPSDRFWPEDESFRSSSGRYGSGSRSVNRESRGSFRRSPYYDQVSFSRQQHHEAPPLPPPPVTGPRSVAVPITSPLPSKDHHDNKPSDGGANDDAGTGGRPDPDHSLGSIAWKPLKWSRPGSLSLSKTARSEPDELGSEVSVPSGKETPVRSPAASSSPAEEGHLKKKQRLGWGEGLAKYEKKKVEVSEDGSEKAGLVQCSSGAKSVLSDTSPKIMGLSSCTSPATPCSVACSSSPGMEDKPFMKLASIDNSTSHYSDPSCLGSQHFSDEFVLNSLLADLLQPEDACSGDSSSTRHTAMSKLLLLKGDISKELEKTENDIDLLENELKSLNNSERIDPCRRSLSMQADEASEPCVDVVNDVSKVSFAKDHVQFSSRVMLTEESTLDALGSNAHPAEVKDTHADSPETVSSNVDKAALLGKESSDPYIQRWAGSPYNLGKNLSGYSEAMSFHGEERPVAVCGPNGNSLEAGSSSADANNIGSSCSEPGSDLIDLIMSSNREAAKRASQVFDRFMPTGPAQCDIWELDKILSNRINDSQIRAKLAKRRSFLKFKEQVLAIRYRAAYNLWREDLHLLYIRKQRPKSQKRIDLSNRLSLSGSQKHRSSLRSRFLSTAGKPNLVPTTEMLNFTSKLMSDSQIKIYRNSLKMPAYILFEERRHWVFFSNNGLMDDPISFEKERAMINPWMQEEKELFMEMLATFGKDFAKIASVLKHKTTADCIEFYYKNHKSESFEEVKKRLDLKKQSESLPTNTYLVTSGKKWKREANAALPSMLGTSAVVPGRNNDISRVKQNYSRKPISGSYLECKVSRRSYGHSERTPSHEISQHESAAANVLAGICGALSSEAMSSCITSSIDPAEKMYYRRMDRPLTPEVTQSVDEEETCSDEGCGELDSVDWTDEEKSMFIRALSLYGKDFGRISHCVGSRTREQCKIFFSKARKCLGLDAIHQGPRSGGAPRSDTNGGRSDTEDACAAEMDSGICSTQSCSKVDADFTQSVANINSGEFGHAGRTFINETERLSDHYDAGGSNEEELETKVDVLALEFSEGKLPSEGENLLSFGNPKDIGDTALRCNDSVVLPEVPKPSDNTEVKKEMDNPGSLPVEACISSTMELEQLKTQTSVEKPQKDASGSFSADQPEKEADLQQFLIPKIESENGQQMKMKTDSSANENLPGKMVGACPCPTSSHKYQHKILSELLPYAHKKSFSVKQENDISVPVTSMLPDPSSICFGDHLDTISGSTLDFEKHANKKQQCFLTREFCQHYVLGNNRSVDQVDQSSHILRGYPLQVLDHGEARDSNLVRAVLVENNMKKNGISQLNRIFVADSHHEKSNGSRFSNSGSEMLCPSRTEELPDAQLRPCSQSDEVQSNRTGDVKLFGKILSHPSSLQKSNSSSNGNNSKFPSPKQGKSSTMKLQNMPKEITMAATVPESSGNMGMEEMPLRSYGFWDGNRIQTGFSKLPESAILLAKCQGSLGGMSLYSSKDGLPCGDGVLAGYQQAYVQELHKRNGFEMVSGLQQQSRAGRLGMNLVGGGGIIVGGGGGSCTGVSDPVAAIKMHYAARATKILSEVDSWRGDVGGR